MIGLSFPAGLLGVWAFGWLAFASDSSIVPSESGQVVIVWLMISLCGYLQWFLLLPYVVRKARSAHQKDLP